MSSWMRSHLAKLYNAVSALVATTHDALMERLQSIRETASLIYNRMMENINMDGRDWKTLWKKKTREEEGRKQEQL